MPKVENMCKTLSKTMCISRVQFCGIINCVKNRVENTLFPHTFPANSTDFSTGNPSLFLRNLFHFSTDPIITIINIYK